ncbi:hypothetical protein Hamer_G000651 [Homarus americanus]|uniref:Uncharacterized protein n=1 Tax=Homarus americanus TaxID=6706 RepID=A0A8J5TKC4_HOMAM|nr:hypothetical protein Hamer_G000651 [Homarus americanus]
MQLIVISNESYAAKVIKAQAFIELLDYIEDHRGFGTVLSMTKLRALFDKHLLSLGCSHSHGHTTRLRQDIVSMLPDIKAIEKSSGCWELVLNDDPSQVVEEMKNTTSTDMRILAQAAKILRRDILEKKQVFSGFFSSTSEADSVVLTLRSFLHILLDGLSIDVDIPSASSKKIVLSLVQTIMHNSVGKRSPNPQNMPRHRRE